MLHQSYYHSWFESFANSERYKTEVFLTFSTLCLRALLIQKDTKRDVTEQSLLHGLRALLIQKDTKQLSDFMASSFV